MRLIGYWKSEFEISLPHPINFVDSEWDTNEKNKVIEHLNKSHFLPGVAAGYSYCRLCDKTDNGYREKSDGQFVWPEGFLHYVEEHNVKPPQEFIDHCINNPQIQITDWNQEIEFDRKWWDKQRGTETPESKSFIDPYEHTYPKFYNVKLNNFDNDKFKLGYRKFLKDIANILDTTVIEMHRKLSDETKELIITENDEKNIEKVSNKNLFLNIKTIPPSNL